jgi:hypothetical protein
VNGAAPPWLSTPARSNYRWRGVTVASLLDADQILDADP